MGRSLEIRSDPGADGARRSDPTAVADLGVQLGNLTVSGRRQRSEAVAFPRLLPLAVQESLLVTQPSP